MLKKEKTNLLLNAKRTWKYIKKSKTNLIWYGIVSIFEAIVTAVLPLMSAKVIINITNGVIDQIILSALLVCFMEIILYILYFFKGLFYQKIFQKTLTSFQKSIANEILNLEISEIDKHSSGLFIDRLNKDTQDISGLFMEYTYWLSIVISNLGVLFTVFLLNKYLFCYALITCISMYLINRKRLSEQYKVRKKQKLLKKKKPV